MPLHFNVPDMTCGHCVGAITQAIQSVAPDANVKTDLASHVVTVESSTDAKTIQQAIIDAGYEPMPA